MSIGYNDYKISAEKAALMTESKAYSLSLVGNSLLFKLNSDALLLEWESSGTFKIIVSRDVVSIRFYFLLQTRQCCRCDGT